MTYYLSRIVPGTLEAVVDQVTAALKQEGFGILTDIDVAATLKQKLGETFRPYRILGACNPALAHRALSAEDKIGVMLPCNVIVQDLGGGRSEVAAINPLVAMAKVDNPALAAIATEVAERLQRAMAAL